MTGDSDDDRAALRDLADRYAAGVDRRDTELFLSAFDPERGSLLVFEPSEAPEPRGTRRGTGELAAVIRQISRYDRTFHHVGNSRYDVTGDRASGEVYCIAHHVTAGTDADEGRTDHVMYIRYRDAYERGVHGWRIVERRVLVDWTDTRRIET